MDAFTTSSRGNLPCLAAPEFSIEQLKGTVAREFRPLFFFHHPNTPWPRFRLIKYIRIRFRIRRDIRIQSLTGRY